MQTNGPDENDENDLAVAEEGLDLSSESLYLDEVEDSDSEEPLDDDPVSSQSVEVISAYLRDIARSNLLTREEELALAK